MPFVNQRVLYTVKYVTIYGCQKQARDTPDCAKYASQQKVDVQCCHARLLNIK